MEIEVHKRSGCCFGVVYAIQAAEDELNESGKLYCLGDIVHNDAEVQRLREKGLVTIGYDEFETLSNCKVLVRAHGEPPSTYRIALENNIELIDASCPVVLNLQNKVKRGYDEIVDREGQIVIYGKPGHAEVRGLNGQVGNKAIIVMKLEDLDQIDFSKPITLFSQTTKSVAGFMQIKAEIEKRMIDVQGHANDFVSNNTICRQVSNRDPQLRKFAEKHDVIVFVSGKKSSNGKVLYNICKEVNHQSYMVSDSDELQAEWFEGVLSVGIGGATSTPRWLMEKVGDAIREISMVAA